MEKIEKLKSFLINSPGDSFLKHALALEYIKLGDDGVARKLFIDILEQDSLYIGSYYHLVRLLERAGDTENAKIWCEKGMMAAKQVRDEHAYQELLAAYDDLTD